MARWLVIILYTASCQLHCIILSCTLYMTSLCWHFISLDLLVHCSMYSYTSDKCQDIPCRVHAQLSAIVCLIILHSRLCVLWSSFCHVCKWHWDGNVLSICPQSAQAEGARSVDATCFLPSDPYSFLISSLLNTLSHFLEEHLTSPHIDKMQLYVLNFDLTWIVQSMELQRLEYYPYLYSKHV